MATTQHLFRSIKNNEKATFEELLARPDLDVNRPIYGSTPLIHSMFYGRPEMFDALLRRGADVDKFDTSGRTPLLWSIGIDESQLIHALLERGADVNRADNFGQTPINLAKEKRRWDIVEMLLEYGANNRLYESFPPNERIMLRRYGYHPPSQRQRIIPPSITQFSEESGYNQYGDTPLTAAIRMNHLEWIENLIRETTTTHDLFRRTANGLHPLLLALRMKRLDAFRLIMSQLPPDESVDQAQRIIQQGQWRGERTPHQRQAFQKIDPYRDFKDIVGEKKSFRRRQSSIPDDPQHSRSIRGRANPTHRFYSGGGFEVHEKGVAQRLGQYIRQKQLQHYPEIRQYLKNIRAKETRLENKRQRGEKIIRSDLTVSVQQGRAAIRKILQDILNPSK